MKKKDADKIAEAFKRLHCDHEWIDEGQYAEGHSEHYYQCRKCGKHRIDIPYDMKGGV